MYCSKCGTQLPDNSQFCMICGTPVNTNEKLEKIIKPEVLQEKTKHVSDGMNVRLSEGDILNEDPINSQNKKSKKRIIAVLTAIIVGLAAVVILVFNPFDKSGYVKIQEDHENGRELVNYEYDADGNIISVTRTWNDRKEVEKYTYNSQGNLEKVDYYDNDNDLRYWDEYRYSSGSAPTEMYSYDPWNGLVGYCTFEYDENGNKKAEYYYPTESDAWRKEYEYDSKGNIIEEREYSTNYDETPSYLFRYDNKYDWRGNLISCEKWAVSSNGAIEESTLWDSYTATYLTLKEYLQ